MCTDCHGLGTRAEMDPDLVVPTRRSRSAKERSSPGRAGWPAATGWTADLVNDLARAGKIDLDKPWKDLPKSKRELVLYGDGEVAIEFRWDEERDAPLQALVGGAPPHAAAQDEADRQRGMRKWYRSTSRRSPAHLQRDTTQRDQPGGEGNGKGLDEVCRLTIGEASKFLEGSR